jgi:hypothetical protein
LSGRKGDWYVSVMSPYVVIARHNYWSGDEFVAGPFPTSGDAVLAYQQLGEPTFARLPISKK